MVFQRLLHRITNFLGSRLFFGIIIGFFVLSASWVALTSLYPMAFDEEVHLGTIRLYAEQLSPFAIEQTKEANAYGSVATDPSYLYHYLMSFPYRLLDHLFASETSVVIGLRFINIMLVTVALFSYRKLLRRVGASAALTNSVLAIFTLIPVLILLAAQINYDNLVLPLVPLLCLAALDVRKSLRAAATIPIRPLVAVLTLCLFGSVVKYGFLPIAAGVVLYLVYELIMAQRAHGGVFSRLWHDIQGLHLAAKIGFSVLIVLGMVLFAQRYVVNLVQYGDPVPDCAAVLSTEQCMEWGPWGRNYRYANDIVGRVVHSPVQYTVYDWVPGMWHRLFFTLAGPTNNYATQRQLPLPSVTFAVLAFAAIPLLLVYGRSVFRKYPTFVLLVSIMVLYVTALWVQVYAAHIETHRPVAINGRYLLPILPFVGVMVAALYARFFEDIRLPQIKPLFASLVIILFLQGGGVLTYLALSKPAWFFEGWPQTANAHIQEVLKPFITGADR